MNCLEFLLPSTVKEILEETKRQICSPNYKFAELYLIEGLKQISSGEYKFFLRYFVKSSLKSTNNVKKIH